MDWTRLGAVLLGVALLGLGLHAVVRRRISFSLNEDDAAPSRIQGWRAVLLGSLQVYFGLYFLLS